MRRLVGGSFGVAGNVQNGMSQIKRRYFLRFRARGRNWLGELVDEESVEVLSVCWRLFPCLGINMVHSAILYLYTWRWPSLSRAHPNHSYLF